MINEACCGSTLDLGSVTENSPTGITLSNSTVIDRSLTNTTVGLLGTTESGTGNTFTYSLVAGTGATDNAKFAIDSNGNLTVTSAVNYATH